MDPLLAGAVMWLLDQSRAALFDAAKNALLQGMGLVSSPPWLTRSDVQSLLDQYVQRLEQEIKRIGTKLDQDRLALLKGALAQVKTAPRTNARDSFLAHALNTFHTITNLPQQGMTGTWRNAELRCVAFLGMAAAHQELHDSPQLIAENLIAAIQADYSTAEQWFGTKIVDLVVRHYPILQKPATPPFPPSWGLLKYDSSMEQIFAEYAVMSYDKLAHTYTLTANERRISRTYVGKSDWRGFPKGFPFRDFAAQTEMSFPYSRSTNGGIFFRMEEKTHYAFIRDTTYLQGYYFSFNSEGSYALDFIQQTFVTDGKRTVLDEKQSTRLAEGGFGITARSPFQVGCVAQGETIDLYAQKHHLTQVKDNLRSEGLVGLAVGSFENSGVSEVQFRSFQLWTSLSS